jgi:MoxR-like ATPase
VLDGAAVREMQALARQVPVASHVREYAARLIMATHPDSPAAVGTVRRFVRYGASPRGVQALVLAGKVRALSRGRYNVAIEDIRSLAMPALRHRLILNFEGEAEGADPDDVLGAALRELDAGTPVPDA